MQQICRRGRLDGDGHQGRLGGAHGGSGAERGVVGVVEEEGMASVVVMGKLRSRQRVWRMGFRLRIGGGNLIFPVSTRGFTGPRKKFYGPGDFAGAGLRAFAVSKPHRAVILRFWAFCGYC